MSTRDQQSALKGARDAEPRADAAPVEGQALQDQIGQALQPAMAVLGEQLTATVRRELEEKLPQAGRASQSPSERSRERPSEGRLDSRRQSTSGREDDADEPSRSAWDDSAESRPVDSPELGRALQEQIRQALQPAMAEFREQMAATVRHELDETLHRDRAGMAADAGQSTNRGAEDEEEPSDQDAHESADRASSKGSDPSGERGGQGIGSLLGKPLLAALPEILEQQGEQWLRSQLDQGIDVLFSHGVRAAIQQEAEQAFQRVVAWGLPSSRIAQLGRS